MQPDNLPPRREPLKPTCLTWQILSGQPTRAEHIEHILQLAKQAHVHWPSTAPLAATERLMAAKVSLQHCLRETRVWEQEHHGS